MTDAERGEAKSAEQALLLWMRERYAAAALDAARECLRSRGGNAQGVQILHGRLTERGYEAVILSRDGMTLVRVRFEPEGEGCQERVELYSLEGGETRTVEL